jgi:aspartate kinase
MDIVQAHPDRKYVIASAPGKRSADDEKITDLLYQLYEQRSGDYAHTWSKICLRFTEIAEDLGVDASKVDSALGEIDSHLGPDTSVDYCASRGEYLNAMIIAAHLGWSFIDAAEVVRFSDSGEFLAEETHELLGEALRTHDHAVIPGFYGATPSGEIKTFSRGGSDVTGALVARATQASVYENWTDVSGILTADPRIVDNPLPIPRISYTALRQLTYLGASVLHENAIYPVRRANIPTHIRNTNQPQDPGTWIQGEPFAGSSLADASPATPQKMIGLAGRTNCLALTVRKVQWSGSLGVGAQLLNLFDEARIAVDLVVTSVDSWTFIFRGDTSTKESVMAKIGSLDPDSMEVRENLALVGVVTTGTLPRAKTTSAINQSLAEAGIDVFLDSSAESMHVVAVDSLRYEDAVRSIYSVLT